VGIYVVWCAVVEGYSEVEGGSWGMRWGGEVLHTCVYIWWWFFSGKF
jgi:hypothetical protein